MLNRETIKQRKLIKRMKSTIAYCNLAVQKQGWKVVEKEHEPQHTLDRMNLHGYLSTFVFNVQ